MALGAVVLGGGEVNEASSCVDLEDRGDFPFAGGQGNLGAAVDGEEVEVVPAGFVGQVQVVLVLVFAMVAATLLVLDVANVGDGQVVVQPAVRTVPLTGNGGGLGLGVDDHKLFVVLNPVECPVDYLVVAVRHPCHLTNDEVICWPGTDGHRGETQLLGIHEVEGHGGVLGSHLRIAQLELTRVGRGSLLIVHEVGDGESLNACLVEAQKGNVLAIRRVPERVVCAKDLFLVDPVRDCIEQIRATVVGDLADLPAFPDEQIVAPHKSNL